MVPATLAGFINPVLIFRLVAMGRTWLSVMPPSGSGKTLLELFEEFAEQAFGHVGQSTATDERLQVPGITTHVT